MLPITFPIILTVILRNILSAQASTNSTTCQAHFTGGVGAANNTSTKAAGSFCSNTIALKSDGTNPGIYIIDHGINVGGLPTFQVVSRSGNTSVFEMTYSETRALLDKYMGDGPLPLAASMDNYRVNRYNITDNTIFTNRLIQGGQRYQKLNLSTAGELILKNVGVMSKASSVSTDTILGSFECSDEQMNQIWQTGARTLQLTQIPAGSTPEFYQISDQGLFVENQTPQPYSSLSSPFLMEYQLDFVVKSIKGGFGYTVLSDTLGAGIYVFVNLVNSSISVHHGSTELDSAAIASATLNPRLSLNNWHTVSTFVNLTEIRLTIDGNSILNFTQTSSFFGSFGVGASFEQSAYFQNLTVKSLAGIPLYNSTLTDRSVLADFLVGTNPEPVTVDGARRDRIAYAGDVDITIGPTFASTHGTKYINGTLELLGSSQLQPGFFVPSVKIQQAPRTAIIPMNESAFIGYSFNLISAISEYYLMTGDITFANHWAPAIGRLLDWSDTQLTSSGLFNVSTILSGDWNYYDPNQSGQIAKFNAVYAFALQQTLPLLAAANVSTQPYIDRLARLKSSINTNLWNPSLQAYQLTETISDTLAQDANAFAILANIPEGNITSSAILSTLAKELFVPAGSLPFSNGSVARGYQRIISPYASGYHLRAAFQLQDAQSAKHLLSTMWASMANPLNVNYTGCFWEALTENGEPGLGAITSLCHAWASAPTGELSRNVLGIQTVTPGFTQWKVVPQTLGLTWAKGVHPTPNGDLVVSWALDEQGKLGMNVTSPLGTNGTVHIPFPLSTSNTAWSLNGKKVSGSSFTVDGGQAFNLTQVDSNILQTNDAGYRTASASFLAVIIWVMSLF